MGVAIWIMRGQAEPELFLVGVYHPFTWKRCISGVGVTSRRHIPASIFPGSALSHYMREEIPLVAESTSGLAGPFEII